MILQRLAWVFLASIASLPAVGTLPASAAQVYENTRWVEFPDGSQALDVRWAIGSADNKVTLRIPKAYVAPFEGPGNCQSFGGEAVSTDCEQNFAFTVSIEVGLPTFGPPASDRGIDTANILFDTTALAEGKTVVELIRTDLANALQLQKGQARQLRPLRGPNGLNGIGPVAPAPDQGEPQPTLDIYYDAAVPQQAKIFVTCNDEQISRLLGLVVGPDATCTEYFSLPPLKAVARATIRFKYLNMWNKIPDAASRLVGSFILE